MARNSKFLKILEEEFEYINEAEFVKGNEQSALKPSDDEEPEGEEPTEEPQREEEPEPEQAQSGTNLDGQAIFGSILTDLIHALQYIDRDAQNEHGIALAQLEDAASRSQNLAETYQEVENYMKDLGLKE